YPVPANNYITVEGNSGDLQNISIVNTTGQPMNDRVHLTAETDSKTFIDLSQLPKGIYFIKTKTASSSFYKQ
ncbi:MAG TPA: T9SS type A sorting domain-containing protein, partial [Puia sp.]|nr:T9SS type A sorting domain-containing protein [Puia sp.]